MVKRITQNAFIDAFHDMGRGEQFTYEGLVTLYDWIDEVDEDMELDVIALCCDFTEYEDLKDLQDSYPDIESMEELQDKTSVLMIEDTDRFIIQNY